MSTDPPAIVRAGDPRVKRLALAATLLGLLVTLASGVALVGALVSAMQESTAARQAGECRMYLESLGGELDRSADDHGAAYPATLKEIHGGSSFGYYGWSTQCPATSRTFEYVTGLKRDPADRTILVCDPQPAHGVRSWFTDSPAGRNVRRLNGTVEFLPEEAFQKEFQEQCRRLK